MKEVLMFALAAAMAILSASQSTTGIVRGVVREAGSHQPIVGASISVSGDSNATSDADGRFELRNVRLGQHSIRFEREGYFAGTGDRAAQKNINVGQATEDITLDLVRGGVIAGRVLDQDGTPVIGIRLDTGRLEYLNGEPALSGGMRGVTDDQGKFRLFWLAPGQYYLLVRTDNERRGNRGEPIVYAHGFYPGIESWKNATPLTVTEGVERVVDFVVRKSATVNVSGRVVNPLPSPRRSVVGNTPPFSSIQVSERLGLPSGGEIFWETHPNILDSEAARSGAFQIRGVRANSSVELRVSVRDDDGNSHVGRVSVAVGNADVEGVAIPIQPNVAVKGVLSVAPAALKDQAPDLEPNPFRRAANNVPIDSFRIRLYSVGDNANLMKMRDSGQANMNGGFLFPSVPAGNYRVWVEGLPGHAYVADIRQGFQSTFESGTVSVGDGPLEIEVAVRSPAAALAGIVFNSKTLEPVPNATVVLVPQRSHRKNSSLYKVGTTSVATLTRPAGTFNFGGIVPGEYTVFAWDTNPNGAEQVPEFLAKYEHLGVTVILPERSDAVSLRVPLISK